MLYVWLVVAGEESGVNYMWVASGGGGSAMVGSY